MAEFVKRTMMGYKEVSGGASDPECTHVILTDKEYTQQLQKISVAEQEARNTKYDETGRFGRFGVMRRAGCRRRKLKRIRE